MKEQLETQVFVLETCVTSSISVVQTDVLNKIQDVVLLLECCSIFLLLYLFILQH